MSQIEFGINVNVGGNVVSQSKKAATALDQTSKAIGKVGSSSQRSLGDLLALQSSLFVVTKLAGDLQTVGFGIAKGIVGGFVLALNKAGEFQQSLEVLRVLAGDSFGRVKQQVLDIAAATPLATGEITGIAARLGGLGVPLETFTTSAAGTNSALQNLATGISLLGSTERARALAGITNIFQDINSFQQLLNRGVGKGAKEAFSAANTEAEKMAIIVSLLQENFGELSGAILGTFPAASRLAFQQLAEILDLALLPILEELTPLFTKLANELVEIKKNKQFIAALTSVFKDLAGILKFVISFVGDAIKFIAKIITFSPGIVKFAVSFALLGGILIGLVGTLLLVEASVLLFQASLSRVGTQLVTTRILTMLFKGDLIGLTSGFRGAAAAALGFGRALAIGLIIPAAIFLLIEAFEVFPEFLAATNTQLEKTLALLTIMASISAAVLGGVAGFFVGGPIGAIAGAGAAGAGTFLGLNSARGISDTPDIPIPDVTTAEGGSSDELVELNRRMLEVLSRREGVNIDTTLNIDGRPFLEEQQRLQRQNADRTNFQTIKP